MKQKSTDVKIGNETYSVTLFMPSKSIKVLTRLFKLIGVSLSELMDEKVIDSDISVVLPKAMAGLTDRLDENEVVDLIKELLSEVRSESLGELNFETHFAGRLGLMFKLIGKVLEVNYKDFLQDLGALDIFKAKMQAQKSNVQSI